MVILASAWRRPRFRRSRLTLPGYSLDRPGPRSHSSVFNRFAELANTGDCQGERSKALDWPFASALGFKKGPRQSTGIGARNSCTRRDCCRAFVQRSQRKRSNEPRTRYELLRPPILRSHGWSLRRLRVLVKSATAIAADASPPRLFQPVRHAHVAVHRRRRRDVLLRLLAFDAKLSLNGR
jgi:hypothetical protein